MSRGPGRIERALTDTLTDEWCTMHYLAGQIFGGNPSRAAVESVRRACRRMVERGTAQLDYRETGYPTGYNPGSGELWSDLGDGRNAHDPGHRPAAPCWSLVARKR